MNSKSLPLMAWLIIGLTVITALPFIVTAFQIRASQDSLVKQTQQTHLVSVTATADKIGAYIEGLKNLLASIADNENVMARLNSEFSDDVLANALLIQPEILAIAVYRDQNPAELVQIVQHKTVSSIAQLIFDQADQQALQTITYENSDYLLLHQTSTLSGYRLAMLVDRAKLRSYLTVPALNDALLGLSNKNNEIVDGQVKNYSQFPESLKKLIDAQYIGSAADNFLDKSKVRQVAAFSRVANTDWMVISQQPADKAEIARQDMWNTAFKALVAVTLLCGLIAFAAHRKIIKPIRDLVASQKRLLGNSSQPVEGSEIEQLKQAFAQLEQHIQDKGELKKVSLGRYKISEVISSGAMGTVFKGRDPRLDRDIAIKTIKFGDLDGTFNRDKLVNQLIKEAKLVAKIIHPNIVTIYDAVDTKETAFLAMELIDGISLSVYLKRYKYIPFQQAIALAVGVLRGLGEAHKHAVIHRDIKPGNVLLGYNGSIKLSDFGIAGIMNEEVSGEKGVLGSPGYIAPELLKGGSYSEMSDIFAVGVLLYRSLIGYGPFRGKSIQAILDATMDTTPTPLHHIQPDIPEPLSNAIMSMLRKNPQERPNSASMVAEAMEKTLGVHKWKPPFYQDTPIPDHPGLTTTTLLPETIIRKHMSTNNE